MSSFVSDFLYAFRIFFKRPGLTILAILALSLSLGMTTAAFSMLNGFFFKPLPFDNPEELHLIFLGNEKSDSRMMPIPYDRVDSLEEVRSFTDILAYYRGTINISDRGRPERYSGAFISGNFLEVLGHEPVIGRTFGVNSADREGPKEILLSYKIWTERFGQDPKVLGESVRANGSKLTIVGVLPEGFQFPSNAEAWLPLHESVFPWNTQQTTHVKAVGRIAEGTSPEQAQAELKEVYQGWEGASLEKKEDLVLSCKPFGRMELNTASASLLIVMISAVIFVLLVSCANVANLLVGRALTRGREMAIRSALGATRRRIIRQLLTESMVLSFFGAVGGLLYAAWSVDWAMQSQVWELPYWINYELDWRVFAFVVLIMFGTALVSGLVPAWQASKTDINEMLKDTSHTSSGFRLGRLTRMLAVVQIAFSCALLFGAGLVTRHTIEMTNIDPGFQAGKVLSMRMGLFPGDYPDEQKRDAFYEEMVREVSGVPGVTSAAVTSWIGQFGNFEEPFFISREQEGVPDVGYAYIESVSPDYFRTLEMRLVAGRAFSEGDARDSTPVVVVNRAFVRKHLPDAPPIGQLVNLINTKRMQNGNKSGLAEIVGVVSNVRVSNFTKPDKDEAIIYTPYTQAQSTFMSLVAGTTGDLTEIQSSIEEVILKLDPNLPVYFQKTMGQFIEDQIKPYDLLSDSLLFIGLMALFLAAIGVYGMLAFNVSRRRREIGIRMALGANTASIVSQVVRQGFFQVVAGLAIGTGLAYLVGSFTRNFLVGINPLDTSVYLGVLLTLVGVATLAFFIPARRAARLSPLEALRYE